MSVVDELVAVVCRAVGLRDPGTIDAVRQAVVRHFGGQQIYIPARADLPRKYASMVERRKSGASVRELARQFGVSEGWVRRVLKRYGAR
jgi:Mor family transcriptional regulator